MTTKTPMYDWEELLPQLTDSIAELRRKREALGRVFKVNHFLSRPRYF